MMKHAKKGTVNTNDGQTLTIYRYVDYAWGSDELPSSTKIPINRSPSGSLLLTPVDAIDR